MIKVTIPSNNLVERKYILSMILGEFLGLEYKIEVQSQKKESNWRIELKNGSKLIIEDHFFNKYLKDLEYLTLDSIPTEVLFVQNEFTAEKDIPVIYGSSNCNFNTSNLICGIDIFASSFCVVLVCNQ